MRRKRSIHCDPHVATGGARRAGELAELGDDPLFPQQVAARDRVAQRERLDLHPGGGEVGQVLGRDRGREETALVLRDHETLGRQLAHRFADRREADAQVALHLHEVDARAGNQPSGDEVLAQSVVRRRAQGTVHAAPETLGTGRTGGGHRIRVRAEG
jgi:hypothetical protein